MFYFSSFSTLSDAEWFLGRFLASMLIASIFNEDKEEFNKKCKAHIQENGILNPHFPVGKNVENSMTSKNSTITKSPGITDTLQLPNSLQESDE